MDSHAAESISTLRSRWVALVTPLTKDHAASEAVWDALIQHYSEAHRAYHNLSHILALLALADEARSCIAQHEVVELAIWFHDVIYDPRAKDNELRSAAWACNALQGMRIDENLIVSVEQCILATQRHEMPLRSIPDLPLFLDLDLAIMGAPDHHYRRYCSAIRAEYEWVTDDIYRAGRARILQRFLARPSLFFTQAMEDRYERTARHNIALELRELGQEQ
jgi:predicted metal-dependent HD superfamily phosphohydrolase